MQVNKKNPARMHGVARVLTSTQQYNNDNKYSTGKVHLERQNLYPSHSRKIWHRNEPPVDDDLFNEWMDKF